MDQSRRSRSSSFGAWAEEYHANRPSYPESAVAWLLGDAQLIVELGAGTGKLTDRLVERGHLRLIVTELDGRMLRLIGARHPFLPLHEVDATHLPVAGGTVDAVLVADAWHWFPKEEAVAEVSRVLRPGGWLGCVWNDVAPTAPAWQWTAMQLSADIAARVHDMTPIDRLGLTTGHAERATVRWSWHLTPREFGAYVATLSHVRTLPDAECRAAVMAATRHASDACDAGETSTVAVEFDAVCIRWRAEALPS